MAVMAKMRDLAPVFIISVGVVFVLFMVISDSNVMEALGARTNVIGSVNGEDITYQQFSQFIDRALENRRAQTGEDVPPEQMGQFRDQVWDALVSQMITSQKIDEFNIEVTNDEISEVILSDNPPAFLKQNFIDSTGNFNREAYQTALRDPRNKEAVLQAEDVVKQQLIAEKLQQILFATLTVSEHEMKRAFVKNNIRMTAEYVLVDLLTIPDSTINVTEEDYKAYYASHKDEFKREEQRVLDFVMFNVAPSKGDTMAVLENMNNVLEFAKTDTSSFQSVVEIYSEEPYSRDTLLATQLDADVVSLALDGKTDEILGPIATQSGYGLFKVYGVVDGEDEFVRASHILVSKSETVKDDSAEAYKLYEELKNGADFEAYAKEYSQDPGSARLGGDLGWFGKGRMVQEFSDACFAGTIGEIQAPVKTNYGYHIIRVEGRTDKKFIVEKIINKVEVSATTRDDMYQQASDFAFVAEENGFQEEAELNGYTVSTTPAFSKDVYAIPGIGYNQALMHFVFDNSKGAISPVYSVPTGYVVAAISEEMPEGFKDFEEVKADVKRMVIREKKYEKAREIVSEIKQKIGNELAAALDMYEGVKFSLAEDFSIDGTIPTIGVDYAFSNAAYELATNTISAPVKGQRGYYLIRVLRKTPFDSTAYQMQKNTLRDNLLLEKKNTYFNQWMSNLQEDASIVDNRYKFYVQ